MFYSNKEMSYLNHWPKWASYGVDREQLFYDVRQLVEDMIKEIVPQMVEEYLKGFTIDVETQLNGRAADLSGLKSDIERLIIDELSKGIR